MSKPWTKKHAPTSRDEFVGNSHALDLVKKRVKEFSRGDKPILLTGPTGTGKTSLVSVLAEELDMDVLEINASDKRNKKAVEELVGAASQQQSLFFRGRIILVDEVDGLSGVQDRGAVPALVRIAEKSAHPMICTANDADIDKLKPLRKKAEIVTLDPPSSGSVAEYLGRIAEREGMKADEDALMMVARRCGGDIRAAVNDLQILGTGELSRETVDLISEREREQELEGALLRIFKTTSADVALPSLDSVNEQPDKLLLWIQENIAKEYSRPEDLARALDALAEADRFFGRIRRWQYYRFYVYIYNLLTAGVACAKDEKYPRMFRAKRPERPLKIWIYNRKNLKRKRLAEQLAPHLHSSQKRVVQDVLPFLKAMGKRKDVRAALQKRYDLDSDAMSWFVS